MCSKVAAACAPITDMFNFRQSGISPVYLMNELKLDLTVVGEGGGGPETVELSESPVAVSLRDRVV